jgi:protein O-GlcNAc transferase
MTTRARVMLLLLAGTVGCSRGTGRPELLPVSLPDLSSADPVVQKQVRESHAAVVRLAGERAPDDRLAAAFGELGLVLHAGEFGDAAVPAYRNAEMLAPSDPRWPYFLGRLYAAGGKPADAAAAFERSLRLKADAATLVRLGRLQLDQGDAGQAQASFERARSLAPRSVAALAGLGQVALTQREFARAAQLFEEALAIDPAASSIHAPLAQAYRGLGDTTNAEAHLAKWRNTDLPLADEWDDQLRRTLQGGIAFETRGVTAFQAGRYAEAVDHFRGGLAVTPQGSPLGRSLRHKLGLALHLTGDEAAAVREFEEAVRLAPPTGTDQPAAQAHYALGVIHAGHGRAGPALDHLNKAIAYDPGYVQARVVLGNALIELDRAEEALTQHREAVVVDSRSVEGRLGYARALIRLKRTSEARAWLEESVRSNPGQVEFRDALAAITGAH